MQKTIISTIFCLGLTIGVTLALDEPFPDTMEMTIPPATDAWGMDAAEYATAPATPGWTVIMRQYVEAPVIGEGSGGAPPFIMMAGYMDTDISWLYGGVLNLVAYVTDDDSPVQSVEIYWEGEPTGVFLRDDGESGDFSAGDGIWGISIEVDPQTIPPGEYLLELRARDTDGNYSDIWPYLTIHP